MNEFQKTIRLLHQFESRAVQEENIDNANNALQILVMLKSAYRATKYVQAVNKYDI